MPPWKAPRSKGRDLPRDYPVQARRGRSEIPRQFGLCQANRAGKGGGVCGPFEPGQCTCLAFQKRPDVYYGAVAHGVPAGGTRAAGPEFYVWDGEQWLINARRAGIPTGSQPIAGALVVWGVPNSAAYGHVAYVERATSSTHVLVSECNYDFQGHCRTRWENPQAASHLQGYVYGGPAGSGSEEPPGSGPPSELLWKLRNSNSSGPAEAAFDYGSSTDIPVVGDWNGDGTATIGIVRKDGGELLWKLRNSNSSGSGRSGVRLRVLYRHPGRRRLERRRRSDDPHQCARTAANSSGSCATPTPRFRPKRRSTTVPSSDIHLIGDWNGDGPATNRHAAQGRRRTPLKTPQDPRPKRRSTTGSSTDSPRRRRLDRRRRRDDRHQCARTAANSSGSCATPTPRVRPKQHSTTGPRPTSRVVGDWNRDGAATVGIMPLTGLPLPVDKPA